MTPPFASRRLPDGSIELHPRPPRKALATTVCVLVLLIAAFGVWRERDSPYVVTVAAFIGVVVLLHPGAARFADRRPWLFTWTAGVALAIALITLVVLAVELGDA